MPDTEPAARGESGGAAAPLSRVERIALDLHRLLDKGITPLGVAAYRRTKGGVAKPWKVDVLLLTTRGRRTGRERTVLLQYFPDDEALIVTAANEGGDAHLVWYLNLMADPLARVEVDGRSLSVRVEELPAQEAVAWWSRIVQRAPSYARYARATTRPFPVLRLVPIPG